MNILKQLESSISESEQDIFDIMHASEINFETIKLTKNHNHTALQLGQKNEKISKYVKLIQDQINSRKSLFSSYLISQLIQNQEEQIRRQRLYEYEHRVFELGRNLDDKQSHYELLLRPKQRFGKGSYNFNNHNQCSQKYRILLEQIEDFKYFMKKVEKNANIEEASDITQLQDEAPYMSRINSIKKHARYQSVSLNNSLVRKKGSTSQRNQIFNEQQCQNSSQQFQKIGLTRISTQKNINFIQFSKQKQLQKIQKQFQFQRYSNSFPLSFHHPQIQFTNENQFFLDKKVQNLKSLLRKVNSKKIKNTELSNLLTEQNKEKVYYKQILNKLKTSYLTNKNN